MLFLWFMKTVKHEVFVLENSLWNMVLETQKFPHITFSGYVTIKLFSLETFAYFTIVAINVLFVHAIKFIFFSLWNLQMLLLPQVR